MARSAKPWFNTEKNTWYIWQEGKKVSLGVRGEENKAEAVEAWHRLMVNGKPTPEAKKAEAPTVAEVVRAFLADVEARLKPATVEVYKGWLKPFSEKHGKLRVDRLTATLASAYSRKPEWSQSSRHSFLSALSIAFKWGGFPISGLKKPPMESRGDKALVSEDAHAKLCEAAPDYFKPFLALLYLTGARPGEVASITADNFDEAGGMVRLKEHKTAHHGGKPRLIFLPPEAVALLKDLKAKYGEGRLLRNCYGLPWTKNALVCLFGRLRKATGLKVTAYGYRHSFATQALANGVPDAQVAALMGHSGTAMLHRHYSHLTAQSQALRDALGKVR